MAVLILEGSTFLAATSFLRQMPADKQEAGAFGEMDDTGSMSWRLPMASTYARAVASFGRDARLSKDAGPLFIDTRISIGFLHSIIL